MKTILIIIAGMSDLPDPVTLRDTPLTEAHIPALDMLARRGVMSVVYSINDKATISHKNSLLSLLGYDVVKGEFSSEELMEFGLNNAARITDYPSLRPFIIPGFSGHGVSITTSAWVRGVSKCALLKPLDVYSPGSSDGEILDTLANLATEAIIENEFVLIYVDYPLKASLRGDFEGKVNSLELIDSHLISPIADFVWKSDLMIQLAITTDLTTSWHTRRPVDISVPAIFYFNNHDTEGDPDTSFTETQSMLMDWHLDHPSDLIRYLSNFSVTEEEETPDLPF